MNKYASVIRTYCARNVAQVVINPPAPLTFAGTEWRGQIFRPQIGVMPWGVRGNFILRQIGLFCQFGEGLILSTPSNRLYVTITAGSYFPLAGTPASSVSFVGDTIDIAGIGFVANLSPGTVLIDAFGNYYIVNDVVDDNNAHLTDYARATSVMAPIAIMSPNTTFQYAIDDWSLLNVMSDHEAFLPVSSFTIPTCTEILFTVSIVNSAPNTTNPSFLTNTIDAAFAGQTAIFDMYAQIEFTPV